MFGVGFSFWFSGLRLAASSSALLRVVSVAHVLANSYEEVDYNVPQPAWIKDTYQWSCTLLKMGRFAEKPNAFVVKVFNKSMEECGCAKKMIGGSSARS